MENNKKTLNRKLTIAVLFVAVSIIITIFSLNLVSAWSSNSFNNSFTGYCYQETANASNINDGSCLLDYTGSYDYLNSTGGQGIINFTNWFDGNWTTYAYAGGNNCVSNCNNPDYAFSYLYVNYTKPTSSQYGTNWTVKTEENSGTYYNFTIPLDCWNANTTKLSLRVGTAMQGFYCGYRYSCLNSTGWNDLLTTGNFCGGSSAQDEDAMIWNISNQNRTAENLTFTGNQNITRYLFVPQNTLLMNAFMNLSGNATGTVFSINNTGITSGNSLYDGLAHYWGFEDTTGNLTDYFNTWNGTMSATNPLYSQAGRIGNSYFFKGTGNITIINNSLLNVGKNFTLNFWIKRNDTSKYTMPNTPVYCGMNNVFVIGTFNNGTMTINGTNLYLFRGTANQNNINNNDTNNQWNMITLGFNGTAFSWYWNGALNFTSANVSQINDSGSNTKLQFGGYANTQFINNTFIDEAGWWNRSLTTAEVSTLYNGGNGLSPTSASGKTSNFASTINNYLNGCTYTAGICQVPFTFHSDTAGTILGYSGLVFNDTGIIENSQTFNSSTYSGSLESFYLNLSYSSSNYNGINVLLNYNNTNYTTTSTGSGNNLIFSSRVVVPTVAALTNKTFYFIVLLSNGTGTEMYNSTSNNQSINPFLVDNCASYTKTLMNFTMLDQDSLAKINGTIEVGINFFTTGTNNLVGTYNNTFNYNTTGSSAICLNSINTTYDISYQIKYYGNSTIYNKLYKIVQLATISNTTINQNITLYNLLLASAPCTFKIIVTGSPLSTQNAGLLVEAQRQYIPQNQFIAVEDAVTDNDGNSFLPLVQDTQAYNFVVTYNGQFLGNITNNFVHCQTAATCSCTITLNLARVTGQIPDYTNYGNVTTVYNFDNSTQTLSLVYVSTDGKVHTLNQIVTEDDGYGNTTICNITGTGTSGTLTCVIPTIYQSTNIWSDLSVDGVFVENKYFSLGSNPNYYGVDIIIELLMFSCLVLLFVDHPITMVIGGVLGLLFSVILLFMSTGNLAIIISVVTFYVAAGVLVIWQMGRKI